MRYFATVLLLLLLTLPGCGGDKNASEGVFIDAPVAGLSYETASQAGTTDENGTFRYLPDETVRFFLGNTSLGEATVAGTLDPFDLVPGARPITQAKDIRAFANQLRDTPVSPMEQVINRAIFLQTLDNDGDLSDGLSIPDPVSGLLSAVSIDFQEKINDFSENIDFRRLLRDGFSQGLWGGGSPMRSPGRALDHLYSSLGLTPEILLWTVQEEDVGNDGMVDSSVRKSLDAEGRFTRIEFDDTGDGVTDRSVDYFYNDFDRLARIEKDNDGNGTIDEVETYQYDARGNRTMVSTDTNNDSLPDRVEKITYDDLGYKILDETDQNGDGTTDVTESYQYDEKGRLVRHTLDLPPLGSPNLIYAFQYDDRGNQFRVSLDDGDGIEDAVFTSHYDVNNDAIQVDVDNPAGGNLEAIATTTYDGNHRIIQRVVDNFPFGSPDEIDKNSYDELGNLISAEEDTNADGNPESVRRYIYDEQGSLTRIETDNAPIGSIDSVITYGQFAPGSWVGFFMNLSGS